MEIDADNYSEFSLTGQLGRWLEVKYKGETISCHGNVAGWDRTFCREVLPVS
jgi:hypothetical protein